MNNQWMIMMVMMMITTTFGIIISVIIMIIIVDAACDTAHDAVGHFLQPVSLCPDSTKSSIFEGILCQKNSM